MGGSFINYFNRFGRQWQVYIEAEGAYRDRAENVGQFYVRNRKGDMVPLAALTRFESRSGPEFTMRYNLYRAAQILGSAAPGFSSAQAMAALEKVFAETMPPEMGYDYIGISFQEKIAQQGVPPAAIFGFSLLVVFLVLAALYESWSLPFSVLLSTPVAVFGADRNRRVFADRAGDADRAGGEKCHSDRRVRKRRIRERAATGGGRAWRSEVALAAHPDDFVRIRTGLRAVMDGKWSRIRSAPNHGHNRDRRNAGSYLDRGVHHPRAVRGRGKAFAAERHNHCA